MSFATIQGQPVICAVFNHPLTGAWTAEVAVDARAVIKGSATVKVGKTSWVGTIRRAGDWKGTILLRMIGGADGLSTSLPSKYYDAPNVGLVFRDICSTVKEKVSNTTDPVLNQSLKAWTRVSGPAGEALAALAKAVGATWRVLPDGTVWFGKEKWKPSAVKFEQLEFDPQAGRVGLWSEEPSLFPGVMLDKKKVTRVEHRIEDRIRTSVWFEDNEDSGSP